ncbi:MAG: hypothetical protein J6386_15830 [Candidatus Synoicihabitans palmerolidicus]|nr:hypothetical protein [Candidatus Synoicihabitans palmerolidicus]
MTVECRLWSGCGSVFSDFRARIAGAKFDAEREYVRRWVPELAQLPDKFLQAPWEGPPEELRKGGVVLGETYPHPVVDHREARAEALNAYQELRKASI